MIRRYLDNVARDAADEVFVPYIKLALTEWLPAGKVAGARLLLSDIQDRAAFAKETEQLRRTIDETVLHGGKAYQLVHKFGKETAIEFCKEMQDCAGFIWGGRDHETGLTSRDEFRNYWNKILAEVYKIAS